MANFKAKLNNLRISPRKVRLVVDAVRGNAVSEALEKLPFLNKKASVPVRKMIQAATASAKEKGVDSGNLFIEKITVDEGATLYRSMPRARGSAYSIRKRTSKVAVELGEKSLSKKNKKK